MDKSYDSHTNSEESKDKEQKIWDAKVKKKMDRLRSEFKGIEKEREVKMVI